MKEILFVLLTIISYQAVATDAFDSASISGHYVCIEDGPNAYSVSQVAFRGRSFDDITHTVVMKNSTGDLLEFKTVTSGTWKIDNEHIYYSTEDVSFDALNNNGAKVLDAIKGDIISNDSYGYSIQEISTNFMSFWTEVGRLIYCTREKLSTSNLQP